MDRDDEGGGGQGPPPELMATKVLGGEAPPAMPGEQPLNPFAPPPMPGGQPLNPFAPPPMPGGQPLNPFAAPADGQPVNPFAAGVQPVNPFAPAPPADGPYRAHAPIATPPPAQMTPHPMVGVQPLVNLRPLTIAVAAASGLYLIALLYATVVAASFKVVTITSISQLGINDGTAGMKSAELFHFFAVVAVAGVVIPWWILAAQNCTRLCADKPRYSPMNAWTFLAPGLNMLVVGNAFEDMTKHSHERRGKVATIARVFRFAILIALAARLVLLLVATRDLTSMGGPMDAAFYVYGFGDPARFLYQTGPSFQGVIVLVSLLGAAIPVLGVLTCFKIERLQREAHRRLRTNAI
jgi:hypothetical protein